MDHKKIANDNHEDLGRATTRTTSRHGVGKKGRDLKKRLNRAAKRKARTLALKDQEEQ